MVQGLVFDVPVAELAKHVAPMSGWLWGCDPISCQDVEKAVGDSAFETRPWDEVKDKLRGTPEARDFHIRRIAYLVDRGYSTDDRGIVLDISLQPDGYPIGIPNGNHRVAAAIVRKDEMLRVLAYVEDAADLTALISEAVLMSPSKTP